MLVSMAELLAPAQREGYAVGAFNTYNLEITRAILAAAEAQAAPVIVQVGSSALRYAGREALTALVLAEARRSPVPVAVHLDHSARLDEIGWCVEQGFTSMMIDGSALPLADNIALTRQAVALARPHGVTVEAELGSIVGEEDRAAEREAVGLTDPAQAERFVQATAVDALAVAVGNVHGFYKGEPKLDTGRLDEIHRRVAVPLVLHGASGLPDAAIWRSIQGGVCKFNVNTELRVALFTALAEALPRVQAQYDVPGLFTPAMRAVQAVVEDKIRLFGGAGRASRGPNPL